MKKDFNKAKTILIPKKETLEQTSHKFQSIIDAPSQSIMKILNNVKTHKQKNSNLS